jgi:hypothetical protein
LTCTAAFGPIAVVIHFLEYTMKPLPPDPVIEVYKRDIDRTLLRENLRLTVEERFLKLMDLQRFAEELRRAGRHTEQQ